LLLDTASQRAQILLNALDAATERGLIGRDRDNQVIGIVSHAERILK
jgi:hypothetical protein